MTLLKVLADGTVYPPLRPHDLVIRLNSGQIEIGQFNKKSFTKMSINYIDTPLNHEEMITKTAVFIKDEMPVLFEKKHKVYILCPPSIATEAIW